MPDHAHFLLSASGNGESISDVVGRSKSLCFKDVRQVFRAYVRWQPSFYDHVLRNHELPDEEREAISAYIRQNPIRAGLGDNYPFCR
jgi:REP element-mobilizing transposase RayT